jgi:hypothetical protein
VSIVKQANTLELVLLQVLQHASAAMQGHIQPQWALRQQPHASAAMQGHIQSQLALRQHPHASAAIQAADDIYKNINIYLYIDIYTHVHKHMLFSCFTPHSRSSARTPVRNVSCCVRHITLPCFSHSSTLKLY